MSMFKQLLEETETEKEVYQSDRFFARYKLCQSFAECNQLMEEIEKCLEVKDERDDDLKVTILLLKYRIAMLTEGKEEKLKQTLQDASNLDFINFSPAVVVATSIAHRCLKQYGTALDLLSELLWDVTATAENAADLVCGYCEMARIIYELQQKTTQNLKDILKKACDIAECFNVHRAWPYEKLAAVCLIDKKTSEAARYADKALKLNPLNAAAYRIRAECCQYE